MTRLSLLLVALAFLLVGCPRRGPEVKGHSDPAADAVNDFLALRTDDYGKDFLLSDDLTGERINVSVEEIATHREQESPSLETVGVFFSAAYSNDSRHWDVDFAVEMKDGVATVVTYKIHKTSSRENPAVLVERPK